MKTIETIFTTTDQDSTKWRIRQQDQKVWLENIFPSEYRRWSRFTHWGIFATVASAKAALTLISMGAMEDDALYAQLEAIIKVNKGFKHL